MIEQLPKYETSLVMLHNKIIEIIDALNSLTNKVKSIEQMSNTTLQHVLKYSKEETNVRS